MPSKTKQKKGDNSGRKKRKKKRKIVLLRVSSHWSGKSEKMMRKETLELRADVRKGWKKGESRTIPMTRSHTKKKLGEGATD